MCNLYSITTNQAAIIALFRVVNRYVGNLAPMPGVFPDYKAPVVRNGAEGRELATARWGMPSSQHALMEATLPIRFVATHVAGWVQSPL
jgi:putative SOS response-associated peptidase YedK